MKNQAASPKGRKVLRSLLLGLVTCCLYLAGPFLLLPFMLSNDGPPAPSITAFTIAYGKLFSGLPASNPYKKLFLKYSLWQCDKRPGRCTVLPANALYAP